MQNDILLAIDNGTQSIRALGFSPNGQLVDKVQRPLDGYTSPQEGWMEHDVEAFYQALCEVCQQLWQQGKVKPEQVKGVIVTTQRATVVTLDKHGKPLRPAIIWPDQRRAEIRSKRPLLWRGLFRLLGLKPTIDALERECEINWMVQNEPERWAQTAHFLLLSGYLNYRLSGDFVDSVGNQVGYIPCDYKNQSWSKPKDWKWSCMPVLPEQLPRLINTGEILGQVQAEAAQDTGLKPGTPVIAGAADKACEVLGSGCMEPTLGSISCGTTATINVSQCDYLEPRPFIPAYPAAVPGQFNLEIQTFRGFWMIRWFKENFAQREIDRARAMSLTVESLFEAFLTATPPGAQGLVVQPYWNPGLGKPGPEARGSIIGFNDSHTRDHMYRAIIEGLAYALREGKEHLEKRTKQRLTLLRVAGGGSQSDGVMQILADVMNCTTERPSTFEASGLGAAIIGAVQLGYYRSFEEAVTAMTHAGARFEPNPDHAALYDQIFKRVYQAQYPALKPLYQRLQTVFSG
jgi:sugar (pentulose or hexulose) kinase